jgi:hypothetical protein
MFRNWIQILPFFIVVWFARRKCEQYKIGGVKYVCPYPGIRINLDNPTEF